MRRRRRLLVQKTAYIDDSGNDQAPTYYVLAGHLGDGPRWEAFSDEWHGALADGPRGKRLEYFKMREAYRLTDQFQGWTAEERDSKVGQLTSIIRKYAECDVVCAMSKRDYDLFRRGRAVPFPRDSPYYYLSITLIFDVLRRERIRAEPRRINFAFIGNSRSKWSRERSGGTWNGSLRRRSPDAS